MLLDGAKEHVNVHTHVCALWSVATWIETEFTPICLPIPPNSTASLEFLPVCVSDSLPQQRNPSPAGQSLCSRSSGVTTHSPAAVDACSVAPVPGKDACLVLTHLERAKLVWE